MKPTLAAKVDLDKVEFPCIVSPKLDGIRVLGIDGKAMSRTMKEIPNRFIQSVFATGVFDGLDGELIVGRANAPDVYRVTNSAVMSRDGEPDFTFHVFDVWNAGGEFEDRLHLVNNQVHPRLVVVPHLTAHDMEGLLTAEQKWLTQGYEGLMGRSPTAPYKQGRATMKEGYLWKLKRFSDAEYAVVGFEELMHNDNEATIDALGHTKRSSHMENKRGGAVLGALVLLHPDAGEFRCGTGFTTEQRSEIWENRDRYLGALAKVKHFEIGVKTLPRFPVFLGWRDQIDL